MSRFFIFIALIASFLAAAAEPKTASFDTERFHIVHTERATAGAKVLAEKVEPLRDEIARLLGRDWEGRTEIRVGLGREEFEALAEGDGRPPSWAVALAYPKLNVILFEVNSLNKGDGQVTLRHELVHVALGRLGDAWPHWFQEGVAQQITRERDFSLTQYATLATATRADRIYKFADLTNGFPSDSNDVELAYAQSSAFVKFLHERYGPRTFGELVDGVMRGEPFETAFGKAFQTSLSLAERSFREALPGQYPLWPLITGGTTLWAIIAGGVVLAFMRRRRQVAKLRAEQKAQEDLEDAIAVAWAQRQELLGTESPDTPAWISRAGGDDDFADDETGHKRILH